MIRNALFALIFAAVTLGCTPGAGLGPPTASDCRLAVSNHCTEVCATHGANAKGYVAAIPANQFRCVCQRPETNQPPTLEF